MDFQNNSSEYEFTSLKRNRLLDSNPCDFSTQCLPALGDYYKSIKDPISDHVPLCILDPKYFSTLTLLDFTGSFSADYYLSICCRNRNYYKKFFINVVNKSFVVSTSMYKATVGGNDVISLSFTNSFQPLPQTAQMNLNLNYSSNRPSIFVPDCVLLSIGNIAYNETKNLYTDIVDFNWDTAHAILNGPLPLWNPTDVISFRRKAPFLDNLTILNIVDNHLFIDNIAALKNIDLNQIYYLRSHQTGKISNVKSIDVNTGDIVVFPNTFTVSEKVELCPVTSDNYKPMMYYGSYSFNQECGLYNISVVSCSLPHTALKNGGYFIDYPHIYVEMIDLDRGGATMYCSNFMNKHSFKCTLSQKYTKPVHDLYITYKGCDSYRSVLFKPGGNYKISIRLPDRDNTIASFIQSDNEPPQEPNLNLQVFILFSIKKICGT